MTAKVTQQRTAIFGEGAAGAALGRTVLRGIVSRALEAVPEGARVVAIVPDRTRDDITSILLPMAIDELAVKKLASFEILIAQGTHAPMSDAEKDAKTGRAAWADWAIEAPILDHHWDSPSELIELGEIGAETVSRITGGLYTKSVKVTVNRRLSPANCDHILIFGAVVPHEVAGFAGGAKYLFPGVSGRGMTDVTHWIGALSGIENVIGRIETPVRNLIEAAADMVPARVVCFSAVVSRNEDEVLTTQALFGGDLRESFRAAAAVSGQVHIKRTGRKYARIVALLDEHYDELWTGGKASYKLGGIIEEGGELIIYAPQLNAFSRTHGEAIERYGYAPIENVREMIEGFPELGENLCVAAHLAHVAYASRSDNGRNVQKFRITLASQIDAARCGNVNLGYLDPGKFSIDNYENDADTLIVKRAGRDLYLV